MNRTDASLRKDSGEKFYNPFEKVGKPNIRSQHGKQTRKIHAETGSLKREIPNQTESKELEHATDFI
jgi:hypothetical protein